MQADAYHSLAMHHRTEDKNIHKKHQSRTRSPIHRPPILIQELLTGRLERIVRPQIIDRHRDTSERINARFLDVLDDTDPIKAIPSWRNNRIMHDLEGDTVN